MYMQSIDNLLPKQAAGTVLAANSILGLHEAGNSVNLSFEWLEVSQHKWQSH